MKNKILFAIALTALANVFATQLKWTCKFPDAVSQNFTAYRGETLEFRPEFVAHGKVLTNLTLSICWQTNGMDSAWWHRPGTVFSPECDVGAGFYRFFIRAEGAGEIVYRANGTIRMLPSPGFNPAHIDLPPKVIDFATVEVINAPWGQMREITDDVTYLSTATNLVTSRGIALAIVETKEEFDEKLERETFAIKNDLLDKVNTRELESLERQVESLHEQISDLASADTGEPTSEQAYFLREGCWTLGVEPFASSSVVTNSITETKNGKVISHDVITAETDGKVKLVAAPMAGSGEVKLVSAEVLAGNVSVEDFVVSANVSGENMSAMIRVASHTGSERTIPVYLSKSVEFTRTQDVYLEDVPGSFRFYVNSLSLPLLTAAAAGPYLTKEVNYHNLKTLSVGVNNYLTSGGKRWNANLFMPRSYCSFFLYREKIEKWAQGSRDTNTGFGPAWILGRRLLASSVHFGGDKACLLQALKPNGSVINVNVPAGFVDMENWIRSRYGETSLQALGCRAEDAHELRIYELEEDLPMECVPCLASFETLSNFVGTVEIKGALSPLLDFSGLAGWSISQANCVYPVAFNTDRSYNANRSVYRPDLAAVARQGHFWEAIGGDSSRPVFIAFNGSPMVIGLWHTAGSGPSIPRCVRALEEFERTRGRNPAVTLKVLSAQDIQAVLQQ